MADRYWVGGTGNWNDTNKWSATSGGSGGASVPTTADNVFFNNASATGTFTVTISTGSACANFDASGITDPAKKMSLGGALSGSLSVAGSWINPTSTYYASTFSSTPITFSATTTGNTITTNGVTFASVGNASITFNGVGGGWKLLDAFTLSGVNAITTLTNGALDLNGFTLTSGYWISNNSNVRSVAFGTTGSIVCYTSAAGTCFAMTTATNFTYTGNSSIVITNIGTFQFGITAGGSAANAMNFTLTTTSAGGSTGSYIRNLTTTGTHTAAITLSANIYGDISIGGSTTFGSTTNIAEIAGSGTQNIDLGGKTLDQPIRFSGTGTFILVNGLTTTSTRIMYITGGTLNLNNKTITTGAFSSTGSTTRTIAFGTGNITLTGSGAIFTISPVTSFNRTGTPTINISNNSATATTVSTGTLSEAQALDFNYTTGTYALTDTSAVYRNLSFTGFAGTVPNSARTIYGNFTLAAGPTYTAGTNATTFAATSGTQAVTTNSQTLDYPVAQNNPGATLSLQDNFTLGSTRAYTLTAGTFNVNGKTASVGTFTSTGSATRSIAFGTGNITITGSGATAWNASGSALTTTGTGTISLTSASAKTFVGGGFNYAAALNQGGAGTLTVTGSNTFSNITNTYGATGATTITFTAGTTQTVSQFTASGTVGKLLTLNSSSAGTRYNLSDASGIIGVQYCSISDSNATGGATWYAPLSSGNVDAGNNLGWIFAAGIYYWVGGSGTWNNTNATNWSLSSGGTGGFGPPASVDTINFDSNSGTGTCTTAATAAGATITLNSATLGLTLGAAFTLSGAFTLTQGTLSLGSFSLNCSSFASTGSATRSIGFGTGSITITGSGATAWNASGSGLTTTGTTSTISLTSASAKTFVGGGFNYAAALNQGGAGTLTVTGSNTFQNITNTYGATGATTITFTAGTTQTVSQFTASGTVGKLLTLNSSSAGSQFILSDASGVVNVSYCNILDSSATGGATWNAYLSDGNVNGGNNTGWIFNKKGGLTFTSGLSISNGLSDRNGLVGNL